MGSLSAPGGLFIAGGRLSGLVGAYLLLIMVLVMVRIPWLERSIGHDQLIRWHRQISPWAVGLIFVHVVLITLGYSEMAKNGFLRQLWVFIVNYPDILASVVGFALILFAAGTSISYARSKMSYESWWIIHLYLYLALALAFAHQIVTGIAFIGHPLTRMFWIALWSGAAIAVVVFRVGEPLVKNLRYGLRIVAIDEEAPGVVSLTCKGRGLETLAVSGGQFFRWRFITRELWWHAHPYSLSALPRPPFLRVTIKGLGDQSRAAAHLRLGTRVFIEGPYGVFTKHAASGGGITMIAAGVGITPMRAILEDLGPDVNPTVIVRASTLEDIPHREEMAALVAQRGGRLFEVVGSRNDVRFDARTLRRMAAEIARGDVFVCGPSGFVEVVTQATSRCGVPIGRLHVEEFSF